MSRQQLRTTNQDLRWLIEAYPCFDFDPHPVDNLIPDVVGMIQDEQYYLDLFGDDNLDNLDLMLVSSDDDDYGSDDSGYSTTEFF